MDYWTKSNQKIKGMIEQGSKKASRIVPRNIPKNVPLQDGTSDNSELQAGGNLVPQVPEIQRLLQNKKTSCYGEQNVQEIKKWAVQNSNL